ncbi:MAG TPA: hypothetical protein VL284_06485 [Thermoanaerobaculia bacterium]|nr:hypothetical protein [Thermoanaerobaculia bacterium]
MRSAFRIILFVFFVVPTSLFAAEAGVVHGKVVGPGNRAMLNDVAGFHQGALSCVATNDAFFSVPFNPYVSLAETHRLAQGASMLSAAYGRGESVRS